jgi:hypothetical protein
MTHEPMPAEEENPIAALAAGAIAMDVSDDALTLTLPDKALLFQPPAPDPLKGIHDARSGMEQLTDALAHAPRRRGRPSCTLHVRVPAQQFSAALQAELRTALDGHCSARMREADRALAALRQEQRTALRMGLLFLAVCLLLSTLSGQAQALPAFLRRLATEGFLIAGWVGMWRPLELLLFDWWPHLRKKQLHALIQRMPLVVSPRPEGAPGA